MYGVEIAGGQLGADWNGSHTFSQSAVDFSMQEYIEPEVVRKNPHLSSVEVRFEASRVLTLRLAQDLSFDRKETLRDEEMVTKWEVADIDGKKQLVTRYGDRNVSLEELWRHTEEFALRVGKPGAFNRAEMQTQLAIQDALIAGRATSAAFTLSHPESVRYVQQWQRREDGAFYSKQLDIGKHAGRDLRHDEVKGFLDSFRDQYRDTAIEVEGAVAGSYVTVRGTLDVAAIRRTAKLHTMTTSGEQFGRRYSSSGVSDRAFPLWVVADRRWFGEYKREEPLFPDRIRDKEKKDTPQPVESSNKQEKPRFPRKTHVRQEGFCDGTPVQKAYEGRRTARSSLHIAAEMGVALHAAPATPARLTETLPPSVNAVKKSIDRHAKRELRRNNFLEKTRDKKGVQKAKREANKEFVKIQPLKPERVEPLRSGIERKPRKTRRKVSVEIPNGSPRHTVRERVGRKDRRRGKRGSDNGVKKVAAAELLTPIVLEKREKLRKRSVRKERRERMGRRKRLERQRRVARRAERVLEAKRAPKKEKKLWVALAAARVKFARLASQSQLPSGSCESQSRKDKRKRRQSSTDIVRRIPAGVHPEFFRGAGMTRSMEGSRDSQARFSEDRKQKERAALWGAQFGWMAWVLLARNDALVQKNVANFFPVGSKLATLPSHGWALIEETQERTFIKPRLATQGVALQDQECTPWALLSIIWYLTMLREGAFTRSNINHRTSKRKLGRKKISEPFYRQFRQQAVIYAYQREEQRGEGRRE